VNSDRLFCFVRQRSRAARGFYDLEDACFDETKCYNARLPLRARGAYVSENIGNDILKRKELKKQEEYFVIKFTFGRSVPEIHILRRVSCR